MEPLRCPVAWLACCMDADTGRCLGAPPGHDADRQRRLRTVHHDRLGGREREIAERACATPAQVALVWLAAQAGTWSPSPRPSH